MNKNIEVHEACRNTTSANEVHEAQADKTTYESTTMYESNTEAKEIKYNTK